MHLSFWNWRLSIDSLFYFYSMKHIKIDVIANEYQQEELIALLDDYPVAGFEQTDEKLIAYFDEGDFEKEDIMRILDGYTYQLSDVDIS